MLTVSVTGPGVAKVSTRTAGSPPPLRRPGVNPHLGVTHQEWNERAGHRLASFSLAAGVALEPIARALNGRPREAAVERAHQPAVHRHVLARGGRLDALLERLGQPERDPSGHAVFLRGGGRLGLLLRDVDERRILTAQTHL